MSETTLRPFGAYLTSLLNRYGLSAASVSRMLGHKSRTTLQRILQDRANIESMEKFLSDFLSARPVPLTADEEEGLRGALEISRVGPDMYRARAEMWNLVRLSPPAESAQTLLLQDTKTKETYPPEQFFSTLRGADRLRMLALNEIPAPFFDALLHFLQDSPACSADIEHYFFLSEDIARTVQFVSSIVPALSLPCYSAYAVLQPDNASCNTPPFSFAAIRVQFASGEIREYQLGSSHSSPGLVASCSGSTGIYEFWEGLLSSSMSARIPIRHACLSAEISLDKYAQLSEIYRSLEDNHDIYMLRPSLCLSMIAPQVLKGPVVDLLASSEPSEVPFAGDFVSSLFELHGKRFHNIYHKKRVTHLLLSLRSLRAFAETGLFPKQLPGLRAFTVEERRQILTFCRDQTRDNPYFNIYFLKNDPPPLPIEATCYDPVGVLLHCPSVSASGSSALITLPEFTSLFSQFFRETLLAHHALSASASVSLLTSLIDGLPDE